MGGYIRCTFLRVSSVHFVGPASRWAMSDGMRDTSARRHRHSYLNQHNSGDEWLTGLEGDAMRSIYGSYYGRISALNV